AVIGDTTVLSVSQGVLDESLNIRALLPGHIALRVGGQVLATAVGVLHPALPSAVGVVSIGAGSGVVALQVENLVDAVGLVWNSLVNGDGAGGQLRGGAFLCGEYN